MTAVPWRRIGLAPTLLLGLALLGGCSSLPAAPDSTPALPQNAAYLSGRLAVRVEGDSSRSFSADFELQGDARLGRLALSSALGTSVARAQWSPARIQLQTSDGSYQFSSLDALAQEALGEPVPLAALFDWLQARPWPAAGSTPLDAAQPARGFRQLGWEVDLERHASDGLVTATRREPAPTLTVRARLDRS